MCIMQSSKDAFRPGAKQRVISAIPKLGIVRGGRLVRYEGENLRAALRLV